jgi:hypothetical protein
MSATAILAIGWLIAMAIVIAIRPRDKAVAVSFVPCDGCCGARVMLVGRKRGYGECVSCVRSWAEIDGAHNG